MTRHHGYVWVTVKLDGDVAVAVRRLCEEQQVGPSEAVNQLIRAGLSVRAQQSRFQQRTTNLGVRVDVTKVAEALESLDGSGSTTHARSTAKPQAG